MVAFIGGLSAATAMVIVESVALSIMISNDLIIPLVRAPAPEDRSDAKPATGRALILNIRRAAIFIILFVAFLYYRESTDNTRLASIGLMSFAAIAQFAPAFIGGLIWRGANARGAVLGMAAGIAVWAYTLLFPSLAAPDTALLVERPVRHRGAAAAGAVRNGRRPAQPRRPLEPVGQPAVLSSSARCRARRCRSSASRRRFSCRATPARCPAFAASARP